MGIKALFISLFLIPSCQFMFKSASSANNAGALPEFHISSLKYDLPKELIAQSPAHPRDSARMMVLDGAKMEHRVFSDLRSILEPGDCLVLNRTKVIPARLFGKKESGGKAQVLLISKIGELDNNAMRLVKTDNKWNTAPRWKCLVGGRNIRDGSKIMFGKDGAGSGASAIIRGEGMVRIAEFSGTGDFDSFLEKCGEMPTPPYIKKHLEKQEEYQCVFAEHAGSIAAPTAGLHFTDRLLADLQKMGVSINYVTLHVGAGTFLHTLYKTEPEIFSVPAETVAAVENCKGRVIYVGTTTTKAMESATAAGNGKLAPIEGASTLFIAPGFKFKTRIDGIITNFHLPESSVLALVCAYSGTERILAAYREAVAQKYRFYSFGDAMLVWRK